MAALKQPLTAFDVDLSTPQPSVTQTLPVAGLPTGDAPPIIVPQGPPDGTIIGTVVVPGGQPPQATVDLGNGTTVPATVTPTGVNTFSIAAVVDYDVSGDYPTTVNVTNSAGVRTILKGSAHVRPDSNQLYVTQVYHDLLGRGPDLGGLAYWVKQLDAGLPRAAIGGAIQNSVEHYRTEVDGVYATLLHRAADPGGEQAHVAYLAHGGTLDGLTALFLASPEYQRQGDGSAAGYVHRLYQLLLGRDTDTGGLTYWLGRLALGPAAALVQDLSRTLEARQHEVQDQFQSTLHRPADLGGESYFAHLLQTGTREEDVLAALLASDEYFRRAAGLS